MATNTRESTFAIAVLVLGTLGVCVALAVDLFAAADGQTAVVQPTPTIPAHFQNMIIRDRAPLDPATQNFDLAVTGQGEILPEERARGIEEILCYRLSYGYSTPTLHGSRSTRIGDKIRFIQWGSQRTSVTENLLAKRIGDQWLEEPTAVTREEWYAHSCPGRYETVRVDFPQDPSDKYLLVH